MKRIQELATRVMKATGLLLFTTVIAGDCTACTVTLSVSDVMPSTVASAVLVTEPASRSGWPMS